MKALLRCLMFVVAIFVSVEHVHAQSFWITVTPDTSSATGPTTSYTIRTTPLGGFSATVFVQVAAPTLPQAKLTLSRSYINSPYTDSIVATITLTGEKPGGTHPIIVAASNGAIATYDTAFLLIPDRPAWRVWPRDQIHVFRLGIDRPSAFTLDKTRGIGWFQGDDSITSFDGSTWRSYPWPADYNGGRLVLERRGMTVDSNGTVWAIGRYTIFRFDGSAWTRLDTPDSATGLTREMLSSLHPIPDESHSCIHTTPDGAVWIFGLRYGSSTALLRYRDSSWTLFDNTNSPLPANGWAMEFLTDSRGRLWIMNRLDGGYLMYDGAFWHADKPWFLTGHRYERPVGSDRNGWIWIAGEKVTYQFNGDSLTRFYPADKPEDGSNIVDHSYIGRQPFWLDFDRDNDMWLALEQYRSTDSNYDGGLARYDGTNWYHYTIGNSGIPGNDVLYVAVDDFKQVWMIMSDGGLTILNGTAPPRSVFDDGGVTSVDRDDIAGTHATKRLRITPNPTTSNATLTVRVAKSGRVLVQLVDVMGNVVSTLADRNCAEGSLSIPISTTDLPTGTYFVQYRNNQSVETVPLVVAK